MIAHEQCWEGPYADFDPRVLWRRNVICSFVCQDHRGRAVTRLSFYSYLFFSLLLPSFSFSLFPIAFTECNLAVWAGGLFWVSQRFCLPPLAFGAFSRSQSCRPGLKGRRRSSKILGFGDLNALQSEPCRVQTERVILLLKLSAAPQMAFVWARDMLGDRVKATVSFRLGESLSAAGKALPARKTMTVRRRRPGIWTRTADWNKIGGLEQREDFTSSTQANTQSKIKASEYPPKLRLSGASHLMADQTKELGEEMKRKQAFLHFQWKLFLFCALFPGDRKLHRPNYNLLSLVYLWSHAAN